MNIKKYWINTPLESWENEILKYYNITFKDSKDLLNKVEEHILATLPK